MVELRLSDKEYLAVLVDLFALARSCADSIQSALCDRSLELAREHPKEPNRVLSLVRWGLIPSWAKDMSGAAGMINARSEAAACQHCRSQEHVILITGAPVE